MSWLFDPSGLTPHGFCLLWEPGLIWAYAISDLAISAAYFTIPLALAIFARRRDLVFRPLFLLFASFILLCGAAHLLDVLTLWVPAYGAEVLVKAATAAVSMVTAVALWRLMPQALALPSPGQLQAANIALQESEARYRASFEQSPVPMHMLDGGGIITGVSASWMALFGYQRAEVIGRKLSDFRAPGIVPLSAGPLDTAPHRALVPSDTGSPVIDPASPAPASPAPASPAPASHDWGDAAERTRLMTEGEITDLEQRFACRDGSVLDVLVSARLERRAGAVSIVAALTDVTSRKRAEAALRASEERLHQAQKMEAVGQLTGGIAHDFNNMLQSVAGALELMERSVARGQVDQAVRFVAIAQKAVERAARLTHRMLAFARRQTLQPRSVEPDKLVQGMEELISRTVGPGIAVRLLLRDGVWRVLCDPNQLESALLNLAINARDAMPDGGSLTIATADRPLSAADLLDQDEAQAGEYVELAVTDTGTGIPPDVLKHVFEPFFTTKPTGEGTGLGLSQVFGFVRQSGGFVRLDSKLGHGTAVRVYLPRHDAARVDSGGSPQDPPAARSAERVTETAGKTVLVVEDEADVRGMMADVLRGLGCRVVEAADGIAGLRILQSGGQIDLLVTDVGLPGLNGRQLADAARDSRAGLPVLLVTGYAGKAMDDAELAPGMEVMQKPFTLDALADRIRRLLKSTGSGATRAAPPPGGADRSSERGTGRSWL